MPRRAHDRNDRDRGIAARGPSQRQLRVGELVRRALTDVLMRGDLHDPDLAGASVTCTEARPSPDLKTVTAYVSVLGGKDEERVLDALRRHAKPLRHMVMDGVTLKFAPQLRFEIDRSFDRMDETRRLLSDPKVRRDVAEDVDGEDASGG